MLYVVKNGGKQVDCCIAHNLTALGGKTQTHNKFSNRLHHKPTSIFEYKEFFSEPYQIAGG